MFHLVGSTIAFKVSLFGFKLYETFINITKIMKMLFLSYAAHLKDYLKNVSTMFSLSRTYFVSFSQFLWLLNSPGTRFKANEALFTFKINSSPNVLSWQGFSFDPGLTDCSLFIAFRLENK